MHVGVIFHRVYASLEAPMGWCSSNAVDLYLECLFQFLARTLAVLTFLEDFLSTSKQMSG
jgi:hypothetical protein